jgi:8-oxo-dGTP diphosphatase
MPTTAADRIEVAAGVLRDHRGRVLVGQRVARDLYYGKWEFPGGKLEPGESPEQALKRELQEELGIEIAGAEPLIQISHDYPDRKVRLNVLEVTSYSGRPRGREGQAVKWIEPTELSTLDFLEANKPIMTAVELPGYVCVTDLSRSGTDQALSCIDALISKSVPAIVLVGRMPVIWKKSVRYQSFVNRLLSRTRDSCVSIHLNGDLQLAVSLGAQGVHLDDGLIMQDLVRSIPGDMRIGTSCRNELEIRRAGELDLDYIFIGPVGETGKPSRTKLGWTGFSDLASGARVPAYASGGVSVSDRDVARQLGGQGVVISTMACCELPG